MDLATIFWIHLYIKTNILPRQARDKHRENTQKQDGLDGDWLVLTQRWCLPITAQAYLNAHVAEGENSWRPIA